MSEEMCHVGIVYLFRPFMEDVKDSVCDKFTNDETRAAV